MLLSGGDDGVEGEIAGSDPATNRPNKSSRNLERM